MPALICGAGILVTCVLAAGLPLEKPATTMPASAPACIAKTVYSTTFDGEVGGEWSKTVTAVTPIGERKFLGHFGGEDVKLSLKDLPPHKYLRLSFDLFTIKTWDGSSPIWGASTWAVSVVDGPVLMYTSFCNCGFFTDNNEQAFPDAFPAAIHPGWTGAAEKQTLGYTVSWGGPDRTHGCDSVYKFDLAFPHDANAAVLQFTAFKGEPIKAESWGLANVRVETLPEGPYADLSQKEIEGLWDDLGGEDSVRAFKAVWKLIGAGGKSVRFIGAKLVPGNPGREAVGRLIRELDDNAWKVREAATVKLKAMGASVANDLREAVTSVKSEEARERLLDLIAAIPAPPENASGDSAENREKLRLDRALQAMEVIGTKDALEIMKAFDRHPRRIEKLKGDPAAKPRL